MIRNIISKMIHYFSFNGTASKYEMRFSAVLFLFVCASPIIIDYFFGFDRFLFLWLGIFVFSIWGHIATETRRLHTFNKTWDDILGMRGWEWFNMRGWDWFLYFDSPSEAKCQQDSESKESDKTEKVVAKHGQK